ncbi:MAG: flagellin FliC [Solirubrobacteraceae bacterium]|nr:flagellin FliC [Solirubrobacteraceae bacterium]
MSLRIQNNVDALMAHKNLSETSGQASKSMQRLSSGFRVNSSADDAAGLSISERMRGQIRGLAQARLNAADGISMVQTAEGALSEVHSMLQRARELTVQYKNGSLSTTDRTAIQSEVNQLASEVERIGSQTSFNGSRVLNASGTVTFQIGANDGEVVSAPTISLGSTLGTAWYSLGAATDLTELDAAINAVSDQRAVFGAVQNRMEYAVNSISTYHENLVAAESRIRDVDMAQELVNKTRLDILQQSGTAMLAQANQSNQGVLQLLQG